VAGAGAAAVEGLKTELAAALEGRSEPSGTQKKEIAFNVVPQVDDFSDDGYTKEELKMANETRKIFHAPELAISATCVRVPTLFGHGASIWAEFERPIDPQAARTLIDQTEAVTVIDDPEHEKYPTPLETAGNDQVFVGRIRQDHSNPGGLTMWAVTDSIRKGAATNVIQVIEEADRRGLIKRKG
jgi:aspartate-semialdehyde dehydrogenase